jgi:hypothetical protein
VGKDPEHLVFSGTDHSGDCKVAVIYFYSKLEYPLSKF